jgi:hypothetical protein
VPYQQNIEENTTVKHPPQYVAQYTTKAQNVMDKKYPTMNKGRL